MNKLYKVLIIVLCMMMFASIYTYVQDFEYWDKIIISEDKEIPIKFQKNGLWGLINSEGKILTNEYWDEIGDYSDGLFSVRKGILYGFIDKNGKVVIEPEFGQATKFSEGLTPFKREDSYGFIDKDFNIVVEAVWKEVSDFTDGLAKVVDSTGKIGFIDKTGNIAVKPIWDGAGSFNDGLCPVLLDDKMGFIDKNGDIKIDLTYDWVEGFKDGVSKAVIKGKYGLIDLKNNVITNFEWDYIGDFRDGMNLVSLGKSNAKYGYVNIRGILSVKAVWDNTIAFNEGLAPVMKDGLWGYVDKSGKNVIPCIYSYAGLFYNGIAAVSDSGGKYMFINSSGKKINETLWDNYGSYLGGKIIPVKKDGKWGFIDSQGKILAENIYDDVSSYFNGFTGVKKDGKWGFVDEKGILVVNTVWDRVDKFCNGLAIVSKGDKQTLINNKGLYPFISNEIATMAKIGLMQGEGKGIDNAYANKNSTRIQSAIMVLRMNNLEEKALNYTSSENFNEAKSYSWKQGVNLMAYLKTNPQLGFIGDGKNNFKPDDILTQKQYVKVMLENLGYKQDIDFKYNDVYKFAQSIGVEIKESNKFTNNDLAKVTMLFFNAKTKTGEKLIDKLIKNGAIDEKIAVEAGLK